MFWTVLARVFSFLLLYYYFFNMFDEAAFNIKFVELVEKYPCIYDYRRQDHSKRDVVEKAWSAIGSELKLSGK